MQRRVVVVMVTVAALAAGASFSLGGRGTDEVMGDFRPLLVERAIALAEPTMIQAPNPPRLPPIAGCDIVIPTTQTKFTGDDAGTEPGTTVCLSAGTRPPLRIDGMNGEPDRPIVFVNAGLVRVVGTDRDYAGIHITNSSHVRITGSGDHEACGVGHRVTQQRCGIVIEGTGRGVAAAQRTTHFTLDHIEITETTHAAVVARTSPEDEIDRNSFVQQGTRIQSNYFHRIGTEGTYIGASTYSDGVAPTLQGVLVTHNLVIDTGWDGLQVGSAVSDCAIRWNTVLLAASSNTSNQNSGIIANRGSACDITHNVVVSPAASGIYVQGNGDHEVTNNLVIGAGARNPRGSGITIRTGSNVMESIAVSHNTIIDPALAGIAYKNEAGSTNAVLNNLVVRAGGDPFDLLVGTMSHGNVSTNTVTEAALTSPSDGDFRPLPASPAVRSDIRPVTGAAEIDLVGGGVPSARQTAGAIEASQGSTDD